MPPFPALNRQAPVCALSFLAPQVVKYTHSSPTSRGSWEAGSTSVFVARKAFSSMTISFLKGGK